MVDKCYLPYTNSFPLHLNIFYSLEGCLMLSDPNEVREG